MNLAERVAELERSQTNVEAHRELEARVAKLESALTPSHTDLMIPPEDVEEFLSPAPVVTEEAIRKVAEDIVQRIADSEPTELTLLGQGELEGTEAESCFVLESGDLARLIYCGLSDAFFDGDLQPAPRRSVTREEDDIWSKHDAVIRGMTKKEFQRAVEVAADNMWDQGSLWAHRMKMARDGCRAFCRAAGITVEEGGEDEK